MVAQNQFANRTFRQNSERLQEQAAAQSQRSSQDQSVPERKLSFARDRERGNLAKLKLEQAKVTGRDTADHQTQARDIGSRAVAAVGGREKNKTEPTQDQGKQSDDKSQTSEREPDTRELRFAREGGRDRLAKLKAEQAKAPTGEKKLSLARDKSRDDGLSR